MMAMVQANCDLQTMFLSLRQRYWINEKRDLPGLDQVMVGFVEMKDFDGRHVFDDRPHLNPDRIHFILIGRDLYGDDEETEQALIHEMAHLAVDGRVKEGEDSHGRLWRREMARLVKLGAVNP